MRHVANALHHGKIVRRVASAYMRQYKTQTLDHIPAPGIDHEYLRNACDKVRMFPLVVAPLVSGHGSSVPAPKIASAAAELNQALQ